MQHADEPTRAGYPAFVAGQWPALLPTAHLLTGTDALAADLVTRGLAAARPAWRALPADAGPTELRAAALRGLVRAHLGRWRALVRGEGALTGTAVDAWWTSPADAEAARRLSAALDRLTPRQRTAVVLHGHEGLPVEQVAALLGVPDAGALIAEGVTQLAGEVPDAADLPARLDGLAARSDGSTLTDRTALDRVRGHRSARRRRWAGAAVLVAALGAGAVVVPAQAPAGGGAAAPPASPAVPGPSVDTGTTGSAATVADLDAQFGTVPRGSLAGDPEVLAALLRAGDRGGSGPRVTDRRVVFAGDLAGLGWGLVVGLDAGSVVTEWWAGPPGDPLGTLPGAPDRGNPGSMFGYLSPGGAAAVLGAGPDGPVFLAVAGPDQQVLVSDRVVVDPDGRPRREYQLVEGRDGVAAISLPGAGASSVRYRVLRGERVVAEEAAWGWWPWSEPGLGPVPAPVRPGPGTPSQYAYEEAVRWLQWPTGLRTAELEVTVLWAGTVPTPAGRAADVLTLAAVLPNGAVLTSTAFAETIAPDGSAWSSGSCGSSGHPAGTDPATLTVVARCDVHDGSSSRFPQPASAVVVTAPTDVASVQLAPPGDGPPVTVPLTAGWGVLADADPALTRVPAGPGAGAIASVSAGDLLSGW